jgi:hypothetical protein
VKTTAAVTVVAILAVAGCTDHTREEDRAAARAPHRDAQAERPVESITRFTEATELFVEFSALVAGEPSPFAVHLTTLDDFRPLASGRVTVVLSGGGLPEERFAVSAPAVPGIFRPVVEPEHAGERDITVVIRDDASEDRHELGRFPVYGSVAEATPASIDEAAPPASTIRFLKEQQWRTDFRTEAVQTHPLRASVLAHGSLRARAGGDARVTSPVAGRLLGVGTEFARLGREVRRDQILAVIAPTLSIEADQASLELAVSQGEIRAHHARAERERVEGLYRHDAVPERRVIEARHEYAEAEAALAAARKRLEQFAGTTRWD